MNDYECVDDDAYGDGDGDDKEEEEEEDDDERQEQPWKGGQSN